MTDTKETGAVSAPKSPARDAGENLPELASSQHRTCQNCCEEIEDTSHIVEAWETTGKIICRDCWDGYCMDNQV